MHLTGKEWLKVPILLEELKGLFSELSDQELEHLKKIAIQAEKRCSDLHLSEETTPIGTNIRG